MAANCLSWRKQIVKAIEERDKAQCDPYIQQLIKSYNRLFDSSESYRAKNNHLCVEIDRMRCTLDIGSSEVPSSPTKSSEVVQLKHKVMKLQTELLDNLRGSRQDAQKASEAGDLLKAKEKEMAAKIDRIKELEEINASLTAHNSALEQQLREKSTIVEFLRDEHTALQLAYSSLEAEKIRIDRENKQLVDELVNKKKEIADFLDQEVESDRKLREKRMKEELSKAAKEPFLGGLLDTNITLTTCLETIIPKRPQHIFEAHEGEVSCVSWNNNCRMFATGGSDRKVKLWEFVGGKCESRGMLTGNNAGVTSVEFEPEGNLLLASSNDFACRAWSCTDMRVKFTLTGHSSFVLAAKFLTDVSKVVSGGKDRIIKLWDLRNVSCIKSYFVGWTCTDLAVLDSSVIVSGHFDNNIRLWDLRTDANTHKGIISLSDKITSLDMSSDRHYVLACTRDHRLTIVDVRTEKILHTLAAQGFHVASDYVKAAFSPDGMYAAAGSSDGGIYVWDVNKTKLETTVKEHGDAVLAVSWNPNGKGFVSCGKQKSVILWSDF